MLEQCRFIRGYFSHWIIKCDGQFHNFNQPEKFREFLASNQLPKDYFTAFVANNSVDSNYSSEENGYDLKIKLGISSYRVVETNGNVGPWIIGEPPVEGSHLGAD